MEVTHAKRPPNPELSAGILSKIFFWWLNPIFGVGYKRQLEQEDLFQVCPQDEAETVGNRLEKAWSQELADCQRLEKEKKQTRKPKLRRAIMKAFGWDYMLMGLIALFEEVIRILQPVMMGFLIKYFRCDTKTTTDEAYWYAGGVSLCAVIFALVHHVYIYRIQRIGMWMRLSCSTLMYRKALKLKHTPPGGSGKIINLLSNDVSRFDQQTIFLHYLWLGPLALIAFIWLLYDQIGVPCLSGFGAVIAVTLIQGSMSSRMPVIKRKFNACTDERTTMMSQLFKGIRVVKMYAWEAPFTKIVDNIRRKECWTLLRNVTLQGVIMGLFFAAGKLSIFAAIITMVNSGGTISSSGIFVASALFNLARVTVGLFLPLGLMQWKDLSVSIERIEEFLLQEERDMKPILPHACVNGDVKKPAEPTPPCVDVQRLKAKYGEGDKLELDDISFTVKPGELLAIMGPVGAGKTSVLWSILDENLKRVSGSVTLHGTVAYVPQEAWMFSATVRKNITFAQEFDVKKYQRALEACDLEEDIARLPKKDFTVIGDRGAQLSGGQRARVNMARAVYYDADVYLFDDPLAAVDSKVGRHLFDRCINGVLKEKVRILATHQQQYLREATRILIMKEGRVVDSGSWDELTRRRGAEFFRILEEAEMSYRELAKLPSTRLSNSSSQGGPVRTSVRSSPVIASSRVEAGAIELRKTASEDKADESLMALLDKPEPQDTWTSHMVNAEDGVTADSPTESYEDRSSGAVNLSVYYQYFRSMANPWLFLLVILFSMFVQSVFNMCDWWLNVWATKYEFDGLNKTIANNSCELKIKTMPEGSLRLDHLEFRNWYIGLVFGLLGFSLLRSISFRAIQVRGSYTLHDRMFRCLIQAPLKFFDTKPFGVISNRFTKDTNTMDEQLSFVVFDFLQGLFQFIGILVVVGMVNPMIFVIAGPLCVAFLVLRWFYLRTSRSLKRLDATTRSPVYSHMQGTLDGLVSIRAFRAEERLMKEFQQTLDDNTAAFSLTLSSSRWLAVYVDWISALFVSSVAFGSIMAVAHGWIILEEFQPFFLMINTARSASAIRGLMANWIRWDHAMVSVERIVEYTKLDSEGDSESKNPPPKEWPQRGEINFRDLKVRYGPTEPYVIKGITCDINPREKIGIAGRTGAGKSSLLGSIFRTMTFEGQIIIDEIDTQSIGLRELRTKLSIIPQEPFLFKETLRKNLDPFEEYEDSQVWEALDRVELKTFVSDNMSLGLKSVVEENGANLSAGQKQLLCLARALLRKSKIIVIDEATANVDPETDELIQKTIKTHFKTCTVLTIAHRLHTIMDSDRIMVMKDGQLVEFDEPLTLLERRHSILRSMVDESGPENANKLVAIAKKAHNERLPIPDFVINPDAS